jgi:hypothetical protein
VIDYKDHTILVGLIMIEKLGAGSKRQISEKIPLQIGQSSSGTNYLQMLSGLSPINQVILGEGLGK